MAGKSIGLFPLQRANAEAVIPELQAIFAPFDPTGAEPSLIRFLALARLNAVLAIAGDPKQMREVGEWVSRLDHGQTVGVQFYVYYLKHAAAEDVAKLLNEAFSEGASSQTGPTPRLGQRRPGRRATPRHEDGEARRVRPPVRAAAVRPPRQRHRPPTARSRSSPARPTTPC